MLYFSCISLVFEPSSKNINHRLQFQISVSMDSYTTIIDEGYLAHRRWDLLFQTLHSLSDDQEIRILMNRKFRCLFQNILFCKQPRTRRFITSLPSVRHLSPSWASPIQSIYPHPTSWRSILILSTHLRLGLPTGLLPFGFPTKTLYPPLSSPIHATCPAHFILLDFITRTILGEQYKSFSSSLCNLLYYPVTSSLLGPNILLNTVFSNTLSFLSSRNVNYQVSHPYKTTGKIIVLYTLIFKSQTAD